MNRRRQRFAATFAFLCSAVSGGVALAQDNYDLVQAEALYARGVELADRDDWPAACERFEASMKFDAAATTQIRVASCRERDGKLAQAWFGYQQAIKLNREITLGERKRTLLDEFAKKKLAELELRVPRLWIRAVNPPPTFVVKVGDRAVALVGEPVLLDVGEHEISAEADGFEPFMATVAAQVGESYEVAIVLTPAVPSPESHARAAHGEAQPPGLEHAAFGGPHVAGLALGAGKPEPAIQGSVGVGLATLGGVGLAVAAGLGIATLSKGEELVICTDDPACSGAEQRELLGAASLTQTGAFMALGIGIASAGVGVSLLVIEPRPSSTALVLGPGSASFRLRF